MTKLRIPVRQIITTTVLIIDGGLRSGLGEFANITSPTPINNYGYYFIAARAQK